MADPLPYHHWQKVTTMMMMNATEQRSQFIDLRSKGWPCQKIASHLRVSEALLQDWLFEDQGRIARLKRALQETREEEDLCASFSSKPRCRHPVVFRVQLSSNSSQHASLMIPLAPPV